MERIGNAGAGLHPTTENIDTITQAGQMMMQIVGALEFERAMVRERRVPRDVSAQEARYGQTPRGSPKASSRAASPTETWHGSTMSLSQPSHASSPTLVRIENRWVQVTGPFQVRV